MEHIVDKHKKKLVSKIELEMDQIVEKHKKKLVSKIELEMDQMVKRERSRGSKIIIKNES